MIIAILFVDFFNNTTDYLMQPMKLQGLQLHSEMFSRLIIFRKNAKKDKSPRIVLIIIKGD